MASNVEIVELAYQAFLKGDVDSVVDLLHPDTHWSVPRIVPQGGQWHGVDGVRDFFEGVRAAWDPIVLTLETVGEVGPNLVAAMATVSGVLAGGEVSYGSIHVFTVEDGKITRFREYLDLDAALAG